MMIDDDDGQMIVGELGGLKLPDICLTGEEKPRKNLTQETCPNRGSNPGSLRHRRACYRLAHSGGRAAHLAVYITNWVQTVYLRLYNRGYARPPFWFCVEREPVI